MKKQLALILAATLALSTGAALAEEAAATEKVANKPADVSLRAEQNPLVFPQEESTGLLTQTILTAVPLSTAKTSPLAMPQLVANGVGSSTTDDQLKMYKQMGINAVELSLKDDELTYEAAAPIV